MAKAKPDQVMVENINCPGQNSNVNAQKYYAMKKALLKVLPKRPPGLTQGEMRDAILPHLPEEHWPGGDRSMWWVKTVQLDLEAKGAILRSDRKPLTWYSL